MKPALALTLLLLTSFAEAAVPEARLQALIQRSNQSRSDSLLVIQDGKVLVERYSAEGSGPIQSFSVTKSFVSLAVGFALKEGKIASLDTPVHTFFPERPEWSQGRKKLITIRHLMSHTSGISTAMDWEASEKDSVRYALDAEVSSDPGTKFEYNNKAANLLSGVLEKATRQRTDECLRDRLFSRLGIVDYRWRKDRANHATGSAGLDISARDLVKVGQMLLDRGMWSGTRIVAEEWIAEFSRPSQTLEPRCGLLWWLIDRAPKHGFNAGGWLGQYLVIIPETRVVAVRQLKYRERMDETNSDSFFDFTDLVAKLSD